MSVRALGVTLEYIDAQRALGWPDMHPEDYCHRCGGRNISWWVDSIAWNAVMESATSPYQGIICPQCFAELFERRFPSASWEMMVDTNTRGGRAWRESLTSD